VPDSVLNAFKDPALFKMVEFMKRAGPIGSVRHLLLAKKGSLGQQDAKGILAQIKPVHDGFVKACKQAQKDRAAPAPCSLTDHATRCLRTKSGQKRLPRQQRFPRATQRLRYGWPVRADRFPKKDPLTGLDKTQI